MKFVTPYWNDRSLSSDISADFFREMDQLLENWGRMTPNRTRDERNFVPAFEVGEEDTHYMMSLDLPGLKKEDIKIEVSDNTLTISGERKRESSNGGNRKVHSYEKSYGMFRRSFTLPTSVDAGKVEARYEDGVLELYIPKMQAAKPRHVEIQTGKTGFFGKLLGGDKTTDETKGESSH